MKESDPGLDGGLTIISTGPTRLDSLKQNLCSVGMGDYAPQPCTEVAALKSALKNTAPKGAKVEGLKKPKEHGFETVIVEKDANRNDYQHISGAKVAGGKVEIKDGDVSRYAIQDAFDNASGYVSGASVGKALGAIAERLGGVKMGSGLFWLPGHALPHWREVAVAVESSKGDDCLPNTVQLLVTPMNEETARAVRDAVVREVTSQAASIADEINSGKLGGKALQHRKEQAEALHERVRDYESILSEGLERLHTVVDTVANAAAVAAMQSLE